MQTDIETARQQQQPETYTVWLEELQAWFADLVFRRLSTIVEVESDEDLKNHIRKLERLFTAWNVNVSSLPWFQALLAKAKGDGDMGLRIRLQDFSLVFDLMETEALVQGIQRSVPGGATLTIKNLYIGKGEGLSAAVLFMSFATSVSGSIVAEWLVSKLKGKVPSIEIDEIEVVIDKGEITKIINRKIRGSK